MENSTRKIAVVALVVVVLIGGLVWWLARPSYGEISEQGYHYALALFSACNSKNVTKVEHVMNMVDQAAKAEELSSQEAAWLKQIARQALEGNWKSANAAVRTLMEEQAKRADPLPRLD